MKVKLGWKRVQKGNCWTWKIFSMFHIIFLILFLFYVIFPIPCYTVLFLFHVIFLVSRIFPISISRIRLFLFIFNIFNSTLSFFSNVFSLYPFLYFPISIVPIPIPCFLFHVPFPSRVHFEPHTPPLTGLIFSVFSASKKEKTSKKEKKQNIRPVW